MCGIVGYTGPRSCVEILVDGLRRLEYRGYDSAGVAIQAGWRDAGLGRAMMERVLEWMRDRQFRKACLSVFSTNARAIALYRKLGFEVEGVRKRQFRVRDTWVDEVLMAKGLE